jgi:hypothetical protein
VSDSTVRATRKIVLSSKWRPRIWKPMGRP